MYLVVGLVALVAISVWIAVSSSRSSGRLEESEKNLRGDVDALNKFTEEMSSSKRSGSQLIASLRARARRGMRNKG